MTEEVFHNHICHYLKDYFGYCVLSATDMADKEYYFVESHLTEFIQQNQKDTWEELESNFFRSDTGRQIIKAFSKNRKGAKVLAINPDPSELLGLYDEIMANNIFSHDMIDKLMETALEKNDAVIPQYSGKNLTMTFNNAVFVKT